MSTSSFLLESIFSRVDYHSIGIKTKKIRKKIQTGWASTSLSVRLSFPISYTPKRRHWLRHRLNPLFISMDLKLADPRSLYGPGETDPSSSSKNRPIPLRRFHCRKLVYPRTATTIPTIPARIPSPISTLTFDLYLAGAFRTLK